MLVKMLERDQIVPWAVAFFVGMVLFFAVATIPAMLLGDNSPLLVPIDLAVYGLVGVVFGLLWPDAGWRAGFWLFAFWLMMIPLQALLGGEHIRWDSAGILQALQDLAGQLMVGVAACLGAEVGAIAGRQRRARTAGA